MLLYYPVYRGGHWVSQRLSDFAQGHIASGHMASDRAGVLKPMLLVSMLKCSPRKTQTGIGGPHDSTLCLPGVLYYFLVVRLPLLECPTGLYHRSYAEPCV